MVSSAVTQLQTAQRKTSSASCKARGNWALIDSPVNRASILINPTLSTLHNEGPAVEIFATAPWLALISLCSGRRLSEQASRPGFSSITFLPT